MLKPINQSRKEVDVLRLDETQLVLILGHHERLF